MSRTFHFRASDLEAAAIISDAAREGLMVAEWIRQCLAHGARATRSMRKRLLTAATVEVPAATEPATFTTGTEEAKP